MSNFFDAIFNGKDVINTNFKKVGKISDLAFKRKEERGDVDAKNGLFT